MGRDASVRTIVHSILVCRDAEGIGRRTVLLRLAEAAAETRDSPVHLAFLSGAAPTLTDKLHEIAPEAGDGIVVAPFAVPVDRNLAGWVRKVASEWAAGVADPPPLFLAAAPPQDAAPGAVAQALDGERVAITPTAGAICDPSWSRVPVARRHVLVCRGPRCSARGAAANHERLTAELEARGLGNDDVLVTRTGCLTPCNVGPTIVVQPDDEWYGALDQDLIARIVDEHLVGGERVADAALPRGS